MHTSATDKGTRAAYQQVMELMSTVDDCRLHQVLSLHSQCHAEEWKLETQTVPLLAKVLTQMNVQPLHRQAIYKHEYANPVSLGESQKKPCKQMVTLYLVLKTEVPNHLKS